MFDMAEYNGVKLLAFPEELDINEFPYLIFAKGSNDINILYAFSEKVYMTEDGFLRSGAAGILQQYAIVNGAYDKFADLEYNGGQNIFSDEFKEIIWSNWNIQTPIGNIYFYGSKPVPVTKWVTQRVTIDLAQKTNEPKIYATQMDNNSRTWVISLLENGEKFILPDDCEITLRCFRPDGKTFLNSTLVNGGDAWRIVDNVISFIPPSETFECAGVAEVAFAITVVNDSETYRLNTFVFQVEIDEDPLLKGLGIDEEPDTPDEPVIPDVPEAFLYLYGTPSTSGNIGLRNGESVTYYEGVVAKPVYELYDENYPIVCITMNTYFSGTEVHMFSNVTPDGENRLHYDERIDFEYDKTTGGWVEHDRLTDSYMFTSGIVWTNTTLYDTNGNVTHSASDPIPVYTGIVDYIGDIPIYE